MGGNGSSGGAGGSARGGAASGGSSGAARGGGSSGGNPPVAGAAGAGSAGSSAGGTNAGGTNAGGEAGAPATGVCPPNPPTASSGACVSGLSCTYGTDLRPACRRHVDCVDGMWSTQALSACKPLLDCVARDGGIPQQYEACTEVGEDCTLTEGPGQGLIYCRCDACLGDGTCTPTWSCIGPPPNPCPQSLPNEGQRCEMNGQSCTYGSCNLPANDVADMECVANVWQQVAGGCVTAS
jgi:hypothetical protein